MHLSRRTLIIIGVVLVLLVATVAYVLLRPRTDIRTDGAPIGGIAGDAGAPVPGILPDGVESADGAGTQVAPRLIRIADGPVAAGSFSRSIPVVATTTNGIVTVLEPADTEIRFIERQSGNIYSYQFRKRSLARLTNQTVPGVVEASWLSDGSLVFLRFLSTGEAERVETYALPVSGEGGYFLEQDLAQVKAEGDEVFSFTTSTSGSTGTVSAADGSGARTVFTSALASLTLAFAGTDFIATSKPSINVDGYSFFVPRASGSFSRILGPLRGLTVLPDPLGNSVLYSYMNNGAFSMALFDLEVREGVTLPIGTIASKCVWNDGGTNIYCAVPVALRGTLPDDWYQGAVSFSDRIWKIDALGRVATLIVDPSEASGTPIDAIALEVDPNEDVLTFTNRTNGSLWAYDL